MVEVSPPVYRACGCCRYSKCVVGAFVSVKVVVVCRCGSPSVSQGWFLLLPLFELVVALVMVRVGVVGAKLAPITFHECGCCRCRCSKQWVH